MSTFGSGEIYYFILFYFRLGCFFLITARRRFEDLSQVCVPSNVGIELLGGSFFSFS